MRLLLLLTAAIAAALFPLRDHHHKSSSSSVVGAFTAVRSTTTRASNKGMSTTLRPPSRRSTALSMTSAPLLTLYGHPGTRSPLVNWACHELELDFSMGDLADNPHPFGQIPCLTDGAGAANDNDDVVVVVFESGAILQYLHQQKQQQEQESASARALTPAQSAAVLSWITWANASLDPVCFKETPQGKVYDTGLRQQPRDDGSRPRIIDRLNELLLEDDDESSFLVPDAGFTLADVAVASYLLYVVQFFPDVASGIARQWPRVHRYMQRCATRPAYGRAYGAETQQRLVAALQAAAEAPPPLPQLKNKKFGVF